MLEKTPLHLATPLPDQKDRDEIPPAITLRPESRRALSEILRRENQQENSAEDAVATAIAVFDVITKHLSQKDSKVILHTVGKSPETLHVRSTPRKDVRTVYRSVPHPRTVR